MVPPSATVSKQRSERRIAVRLPLKVRGRDARGFAFEEDTASENLCRNGAAFVTHFDVAIGCDLEIRIPFSQYASRRASSAHSSGSTAYRRTRSSRSRRNRPTPVRVPPLPCEATNAPITPPVCSQTSGPVVR